MSQQKLFVSLLLSATATAPTQALKTRVTTGATRTADQFWKKFAKEIANSDASEGVALTLEDKGGLSWEKSTVIADVFSEKFDRLTTLDQAMEICNKEADMNSRFADAWKELAKKENVRDVVEEALRKQQQRGWAIALALQVESQRNPNMREGIADANKYWQNSLDQEMKPFYPALNEKHHLNFSEDELEAMQVAVREAVAENNTNLVRELLNQPNANPALKSLVKKLEENPDQNLGDRVFVEAFQAQKTYNFAKKSIKEAAEYQETLYPEGDVVQMYISGQFNDI